MFNRAVGILKYFKILYYADIKGIIRRNIYSSAINSAWSFCAKYFVEKLTYWMLVS